MFDRGFKLSDECAQRFIYYASPPGTRSAAQMTPSENIKCELKILRISNLRILVQQVI